MSITNTNILMSSVLITVVIYIRISIEPQDVFTRPSDSYLIFEGRLTKADGTSYANTDEVALTNNAIMHLFSRIEYHVSNQLIESLNYPGQATTKK